MLYETQVWYRLNGVGVSTVVGYSHTVINDGNGEGFINKDNSYWGRTPRCSQLTLTQDSALGVFVDG